MENSIEELRKLPIGEKLQLVEQLWDDIANSDEPFPLPPWIVEEAKRRAAALEAHPETALTREEVWRRVDEKYAT